MDNRVGIDCGSGGLGRAMGENWDSCNRTTIFLKAQKINKKFKKRDRKILFNSTIISITFNQGFAS